MITRIISALFGLPIILLFLYIRGYYLIFFVAAISLIGLYEFYRAVEKNSVKTMKQLGYIIASIYFALLALDLQINSYSFIIAFTLISVFSYEIITMRFNINGLMSTILGILYIPFMISHIVYINRLESGSFLIWLPFLTAWFTDTFAYFVGVTIGKRKLCPRVSPNKSIEGAIGGVLGSILLSILTGVIFSRLGYSVPLIHFVIIGLLCSIASQLGDLAASYLKRQVGIKDFGTLIPGHGGILDRFDSILFTAPIVYYYCLFLMP